MGTVNVFRRSRFASRLAGALLLGTATLLMPKPDPTDHWAKPVEIVDVIHDEQAPDPGEPLPGGARLLWALVD